MITDKAFAVSGRVECLRQSMGWQVAIDGIELFLDCKESRAECVQSMK